MGENRCGWLIINVWAGFNPGPKDQGRKLIPPLQKQLFFIHRLHDTVFFNTKYFLNSLVLTFQLIMGEYILAG